MKCYDPPMHRSSLYVLLGILVGSLCCACGGPTSPTDASVQPDADAARDAVVTPDADGMAPAPTCDGGCSLGLECCVGSDGVARCVNLVEDPEHCGECGLRCADGRGDRCILGLCACGNSPSGCAGIMRSMCCPPRAEGDLHYCANLEEDGNDCGGCNDACSPAAADRCEAGRCICGDGRGPCEGTPASTCCSGAFAATECVDLRSDVRHCGGCDVRCRPSESCVEGVCTLGSATCTETCIPGHVCCFGECCPRARCDMGLCGADAGMSG